MAQSQLALYNLALSHCGQDFTIADTTESTIPAAICNLHYENVRQVVLRSAHWNSAKRFARLTEEAERDVDADWVSTDPMPGFAFSYALPSSILAARYLTTFEEFELSVDNDKKILSCNVGGAAATDAPVLCYTIDETDPTKWEPDLYAALSWSLAGNICMGLNGKVARAQFAIDTAYRLVLSARANSANEMNRLFEKQAQVHALRGHSQAPSNAFIYPYGNFFLGSGAPPK